MTNCKCGCEVRWCSHIEIEEGKYTKYKCAGSTGLSEVIFNFCPECGAKRPERKKKSLADKLRDQTVWTFDDCKGPSVPVWETTAKAAVEHFCELVDEAQKSQSYSGALTLSFSNYLKKKFREQA